MTNRRSIDITLRCGAAALAIGLALGSSAALAQAAPPPTAVPAAEEDAPTGGDIVITGSRIARPDLESTSPTVVVSSQDIALKAASANIENVLNDLPQVTAATSSTSNNPGGGVATANLRGIGSQRTLVLVDGRRYLSFDTTQIVDLNTIPSSLISRVDVVTGGQSAVYGSDAIAGVVNFVLKRDFSGVELNSQYNVTERGDGQIWDVNGAIGTNFADDRGNVTVYGQYTKRKPTFAGQRDFSRDALNDNVGGVPGLVKAGGSGSVPQGRINVPGLNAALGNGCADNDAVFQVFNPDGSSKCYATADGYNFNPINYLQVPQERFLVAAMGQYEINEHFTPYFEAQFANNRVNAQLAATPISNGTPFGNGTTGPVTIQTDSPFLSPAVQAALGSLDTDGDGYVDANFNFRTVQSGPRINMDERNAFRIVAGMKGDIGAGFTYDGYYMYARTKNSQRQDGNVAIDRFLDAVTTAFDANGNLVCASGNSGCAPANIFGLNNLSPEAINYITIGATNLEEYTTEVASISITNPSLVNFGTGDVGIALGAEWRKEAGAVIPDQFLASGNVAGFNPGQPTSGSYSVTEFFGELRVPLIHDSFIYNAELNGAARYSHYSNAVRNVFTWAAGGEISPIRDLTFRGQYQKAVRGPSVNELYLGQTVSFAGNADQCGTAAATAAGSQLNAICVAQFNAVGAPLANIGNPAIQDTDVNPLTFTGGNPNLREEEARTYTLGGIFQPSFLPRFSLTVDYYNIDIRGYIAPIPTDALGTLCFTNFDPTACSQITRNSIGQIDTFRAFNENSGGLKTSGFDISAGYSYPLGSFLGSDNAKLAFNFTGTRLTNLKYTPVTGLNLVVDCEGRFGAQCNSIIGPPTPKWRHTLRTTLGLGDISLSGQWRYIGSARDDDPGTVYGVERIKAYSYFDLTTSFNATENFQLNVGVSNLFDKTPPLAASTQNGGNGEQSNTFPTLYDVLGRSYFVSGRLRF